MQTFISLGARAEEAYSWEEKVLGMVFQLLKEEEAVDLRNERLGNNCWQQ